jgi:hypothetical protein
MASVASVSVLFMDFLFFSREGGSKQVKCVRYVCVSGKSGVHSRYSMSYTSGQ